MEGSIDDFRKEGFLNEIAEDFSSVSSKKPRPFGICKNNEYHAQRKNHVGCRFTTRNTQTTNCPRCGYALFWTVKATEVKEDE